MRSTDSFSQNIISTFGLIISLITAVLPLFSKGFLTNLFINEGLSQPISFLSFMIGAAIIWQITQFEPYPKLNLGKSKDRGRGYPEPWKVINTNQIIWVLMVFCIFLSLAFFYFPSVNANVYLEIAQALSYILFFLGLITIFAILFAQTRQRFIWRESKDQFPQTVFETLEKNRLIKPWIEIYENQLLSVEDREKEGVSELGLLRKITVKTSIQEEKVIKFIITSDGKDLIKVLKKST